MKKIKNIFLFIIAVVVTVLTVVIGTIYNIIKSIIESCQLKFWKGFLNFLRYWWYVIKQFFFVILELFYYLAYVLDLLWNVFGGEMFEDWFTPNEKTMFGVAGVTVSAAIGHQILHGKLTKFGQWFSGVLDFFFNEEDHCVNAWNKYELKTKQNAN